jgi:N-acetylmuramoyl-L-alanine amidase
MRELVARKRRLSPGPRAVAKPLSGVLLAALAAAAALALAAGCAPGPELALPPTPPLKAGPRAGYDGRRDSLDSVDATAVRGKRIAIDPGHGGFYPGTVGVKGLTEKEVNLAVALELRDLLRAAGAEVLLTRETDRDFLTPADSSLRSDLLERSRLSNAFQPDLFVSIHHNADANGAHDVNETQTYYQLGDEGPSYDAAQDVFRATTRNLGIDICKMIPGQFLGRTQQRGPCAAHRGQLRDLSADRGEAAHARRRAGSKRKCSTGHRALTSCVARRGSRCSPRSMPPAGRTRCSSGCRAWSHAWRARSTPPGCAWTAPRCRW